MEREIVYLKNAEIPTRRAKVFATLFTCFCLGFGCGIYVMGGVLL